MKLKDLEKIKLLETTLMVGIPFGLILANRDPGNVSDSLTWFQASVNHMPDNLLLYTTLASVPKVVDFLLFYHIEPKAEDYKQIKSLYDSIVNNLATFLKEMNLTDPVEVFTVFQFMYRNGYLSFNHNFNYDVDMKDMSKLNGVDVVRGTGVCRSIASFLTDLYKAMGYNASNLLVSANRTVLKNIDRQGNYPKWKISKKTNRFVKTISSFSDIVPISNHLINMVEKDGITYIFDPTNDAFLQKGGMNKFVLPEKKEGRMTFSYLQHFFARLNGSMGNISSCWQLYNDLQNPTIDYEEYKEIYKKTLIFIKENKILFEEFYAKNQQLYAELFEKLSSQSSLLLRMYPELKWLTNSGRNRPR